MSKNNQQQMGPSVVPFAVGRQDDCITDIFNVNSIS